MTQQQKQTLQHIYEKLRYSYTVPENTYYMRQLKAIIEGEDIV